MFVRRTLGSFAAGASAASFIPAAANNFGTASNWVGVGQQAFSQAVGAGATGILGTVGAALPWIGAGLAVASLADNLIRCGTIGQAGCQKRTAAKLSEAAAKACFQVLWDYEQGNATYAQAAQFIQQKVLGPLQKIQMPRWSLTGLNPNYFGTFCTMLWQIAPRSSQTAAILCPAQPKGAMAIARYGDRGGALGHDASLYDVIESCLAALGQIQPSRIKRPILAAASSSGSQPAAPVAAVASTSSKPFKIPLWGWGLLGAGGLLVFL